MGGLHIRPSRTRDVLDVAGYYAASAPGASTDPTDVAMFYNQPEPKQGNRRQRRAAEAHKRRKKK